jgi:WD40 repeat protein
MQEFGGGLPMEIGSKAFGRVIVTGCGRSHGHPAGAILPVGPRMEHFSFEEQINGRVEVGPINTKQIGVWLLACSPSGERIASGGWSKTICIWDTNTGEFVVSPIQDLGKHYMTSVVWSSDSTKIYSASDRFACVLNSTSGELFHSFEHNDALYSVALSLKNNVLGCVGLLGLAQLWDRVSSATRPAIPSGASRTASLRVVLLRLEIRSI